uniref:Ig-like domain-containing protein n=1 Tax=Cyprinus carpio TaxID=7962 RepID=A0A8C1TU93_CYPCA
VEGDSVTLCDDMKINKKDDIKWYFNSTRIAEIAGDKSEICTDQCPERFRDRLKLDHQTGSLTITNITVTDSGLYRQENISVSAAERDVSVMEGKYVTVDPGETKNPNDTMRWYFYDILIAEITGDQSEICTDVQCKERFRDRLKLNHQTGFLTIMNTRTTDSGEYKLKITISDSSCSITRVKRFSVAVTCEYIIQFAVIGICVGLFVLGAAAGAGVFYCRRRSHTAVSQIVSITYS